MEDSLPKVNDVSFMAYPKKRSQVTHHKKTYIHVYYQVNVKEVKNQRENT